jgi:hypothetical protein
METTQIISWLYDKAARAHDHSYARMLNMTAKRLKELDAAVGDKKTPTTNGDRIRAMSDEELADFVTNCGCCDRSRNCRPSCKDCTMEWLKQPAEVDHE